MLNYYFKTQNYYCVKTFWPVLNNQTVIDTNSCINSRNNTILISMFLFLYSIYQNSTLETEISERRLINLVSMVEIKNSLGSLGLVLFGLTINKNIDCLLVIENIGFLLIKHLSNQQLISCQAIVTLPCVVFAFINSLESLLCSTQILLW